MSFNPFRDYVLSESPDSITISRIARARARGISRTTFVSVLSEDAGMHISLRNGHQCICILIVKARLKITRCDRELWRILRAPISLFVVVVVVIIILVMQPL
jgi:uncharacterized membrane protein